MERISSLCVFGDQVADIEKRSEIRRQTRYLTYDDEKISWGQLLSDQGVMKWFEMLAGYSMTTIFVWARNQVPQKLPRKFSIDPKIRLLKDLVVLNDRR